MLKTNPPASYGCGYFKTKCAEIHYQTTDFSILCIFCGMKIKAFGDFVSHFQKLHFEDFDKTLQCSAESITMSIHGARNPHTDPLDVGSSGVAEDPDEVIRKLNYCRRRAEISKMDENGSDYISSFSDRNEMKGTCNGLLPAEEFDVFNEPDSEPLINKIKAEEANVAISLDPIKCKCSQVAFEEQGNDICKDENCAYSLVSENRKEPEYHRDCDDSNDDGDSDGRPDTETKDVDWSRPYHPNLLRNHEKRPYKPRNKPNLCTYCGRTFKRRYQLETHLNVHTGQKPHQCEICGRLFRAVTTLTRHLSTHEQRETFHCKFCQKSFTHKVALLSHEVRHTQERTVPCNECDKWFYTANQMDTHRRKVHNKSDQDALPFVCDICLKCYRSASMLSTHKFKKHYKTAKYSCELCGKKFVIEQHLLSHKQVHIDIFSLNDLQSQQSTTEKL